MKKKGHRHSAKTRRLMSQKAQGKNNAFYGRKHSKKSRTKISKGISGRKNPMFGKHHSAATIRKISIARRRRVSKSK